MKLTNNSFFTLHSVVGSKCQNSKRANVRQTFHNRSTKVPKRLSLFPNRPHGKSTYLFGPGEQIQDQIETICSTRQFREQYQNVLVSFPQRYRNVCPLFSDTVGVFFNYPSLIGGRKICENKQFTYHWKLSEGFSRS